MDITSLLKNSNLKTLLNTNKLAEELVLQRDDFKDLIRNVDTLGKLKTEDIDMYLRMLSDKDFISIIEDNFTRENYKLLDQDVYTLLNNNYKPKKRAFLFVKERLLNRYLIRAYIKYDWVLKAMAIDYSKFLSQDLIETYKEYFEDNTRIIEEVLLNGNFSLSTCDWVFDREYNILIFKSGKKEVQWTIGEAENTFSELI